MILAAEYTQGTKTRPAIVALNTIVDGHRTWGPEFTVTSKREARLIAKKYGFTPWNF